MLELLRYVVLNPVRAKIVDHPADYEWTSYRATAGLTDAPAWLATGDALIAFGEDQAIAQARYARFVAEGVGVDQSPWTEVVGQIYLGSDAWLGDIREKVKMRLRPDAHPRMQREVRPVAMADVIASVAQVFAAHPNMIRTGHGGSARMLAAWLGRHDAELTLPAIAAGLRLRSASQASTLIQRCDVELDRDEALRASMTRCSEALYPMKKTGEPKA